jgi:hypothetical protein
MPERRELYRSPNGYVSLPSIKSRYIDDAIRRGRAALGCVYCVHRAQNRRVFGQ